jgi:hypothetical protein
MKNLLLEKQIVADPPELFCSSKNSPACLQDFIAWIIID